VAYAISELVHSVELAKLYGKTGIWKIGAFKSLMRSATIRQVYIILIFSSNGTMVIRFLWLTVMA
jgi:hypothetical protein